jgi:hypothetical protein
VLIRWPVALIGSSLISNRRRIPDAAFLDVFVIFYALSNVGLYFVDESAFRNFKFNRGEPTPELSAPLC